MAKKFFTVFLTVVMVSCLFAQDKSVQITVRPRNVIGKIDKKIYGQFLEHIIITKTDKTNNCSDDQTN